jgi:uncharacterized membrane protein required for colicin V production
MVTLLILLILFVGAYAGYKKGVMLQLIQTIGYAIVFIIAMNYYQLVADYFYLLIPYPTPFAPESNPYLFYDESLMFSLDYSYYDILAFIAIMVVGWLVVKFFTKLISYTLEKIRLPESLSGIGGAILGFLVNYIGLFGLLFLLTTIPYDFVQNRLADSFLAENMIRSTPILSDRAYQTFILDVHEETMQNEPTMNIEEPTEETNEDQPTQGENSE